MNRIYIPIIAVALVVVGVGTLEFLNSTTSENDTSLETNDNPHYNSIDQKIQKLATSAWNKAKLQEIEADLYSKKSLGLIKNETANNLKNYLYGEYIRVLIAETNKRVTNATYIGDISAVHAELKRLNAIPEYRNSVAAPLAQCNVLVAWFKRISQIGRYIKNDKYDFSRSNSFKTDLYEGSVDNRIKNSQLVTRSYSKLKTDLNDFEETHLVFMKAYENDELLDCPDLIDFYKENFDYPNKYMYYLRTYTTCLE
jgi:hypothetical protein